MDSIPGYSEYHDWFFNKFESDLSKTPFTIYNYVTQKLVNDFENCIFWKNILRNLNNFNDEYYIKHGYPLLKPDKIEIFTKPYDSLINKCYRKNILQNENFPNSPTNGWVTPENWFTEIKDLLRTSIVVRYLDGVQFISKKIQEYALQSDFRFTVDYEARDEGYYAAHITVFGKFNIINKDWDNIEVEIPIEIQITTQLQEVIKGLLHKVYEECRIKSELNDSIKWQWDYKSLEFNSNYLGHILHYVEGMILEVRDKQKEK